jgi:hypothetical protein
MNIREKNQRGREVQALLTKAFRVLRSKRFGMIARQRFSCCRSCAGGELAIEVHEKVQAGKLDPETFGGVVFATMQNIMIEKPGSFSTGRVNDIRLSYGPVEYHSPKRRTKVYGPKAKAVGETICKVFDEVGVPYEWNGSGEQTIKIVPLRGCEEAA